MARDKSNMERFQASLQGKTDQKSPAKPPSKSPAKSSAKSPAKSAGPGRYYPPCHSPRLFCYTAFYDIL